MSCTYELVAKKTLTVSFSLKKNVGEGFYFSMCGDNRAEDSVCIVYIVYDVQFNLILKHVANRNSLHHNKYILSISNG